MLELLRRVLYFFRRQAFERELAEEMQHHLDMRAAESAAGSAPPRPFGNAATFQEESRAMWNFAFLEQIAQDFRYAFRAMGASRLFTVTAVLSLALGVGANTAIFGFMEAILLRALPVSHAEELAVLHWRVSARTPVVRGTYGTMHREGKTGRTSPNFPYAALSALAEERGLLQTIFAYTTHGRFNLVIDGQGEQTAGELVSGNFYAGLGVVPAAGRLISSNDDRAGAPPVAVFGYSYWQKRFEGNRAAIGRTILVNNTPVVIVGVSAPGFFGVDPSARLDIALPLRLRPVFSDRPEADEKRFFHDPNFYWAEMIARLRPGVSLAQAQTALAARFQQFALSTVTKESERTSPMPALWLEPGSSGLESLRREYSEPLYILMIMTGLILAIACANVANLLLARAAARRREMAVRLSLGASRPRLIRQLLTESVALAVTGAAAGLLVAFWGIRFITWVIGNGEADFTLHAQLNWSVLAFALGVAVAAGVLFGLAPALESTRIDLTPALKNAQTGASRGPRHLPRPSLGHVLVAVQIAISLVLVFGAGLFVKTLSNLLSVDLGFNRENVLLFSLNARQAGFKDEALTRFYAGVAANAGQIPGVRSVGMSNFPLVAYFADTQRVTVPGAPPVAGSQPEGWILHVDEGFLKTMQIPVLIGRGFTERDMLAANTAVVNQKFAQVFFDGGNPVGRHFLLGGPKNPVDFEVVGVARAAHFNSIQEEILPTAYLPYTQDLPSLRQMYYEVRAQGDPLALTGAIRAVVRQASPAVGITEIGTQAQRIEQTVFQRRTFARLFTCFAVLALSIASVGLYGAMAYAVARRTRELGIRMALGAKRGAIVFMVLRDALIVSAAGLVVGFFAIRAASSLVESMLFGLKPNDPAAFAVSISILLAASIAAALIPAWKASRTDPMLAIRHE
jgi:predicted permease